MRRARQRGWRKGAWPRGIRPSKTRDRAQDRETLQSALDRIRQAARKSKELQFTTLWLDSKGPRQACLHSRPQVASQGCLHCPDGGRYPLSQERRTDLGWRNEPRRTVVELWTRKVDGEISVVWPQLGHYLCNRLTLNALESSCAPPKSEMETNALSTRLNPIPFFSSCLASQLWPLK